MPEKSRIKNLSTRFLLPYKIFIWVILTVVLALLCYETWFRFSSIVLTLSWGFILFRYYVMNQKLYQVEFDDEFLYVLRKNVDILVPLENIKDLNIKTLIGHYEIIFYNREQVGEKIYFKPSLLYPANARKKDELVDMLWQNINKSKMKQPHFQRNALHS